MLHFLYQALAAEYGVVLRTMYPTLILRRLYVEREKAKDPDLDILSFHPSPTLPAEEIWIVKRSKDGNAP